MGAGVRGSGGGVFCQLGGGRLVGRAGEGGGEGARITRWGRVGGSVGAKDGGQLCWLLGAGAWGMVRVVVSGG